MSDTEVVRSAKDKYTDGRGFDLVFDAAGTNKTMLTALELAKNHADVCLVGTPSKAVTFEKREWETINRKELWVTGTWMSYSNPFPGEEWQQTAQAIKDRKLILTDDFFAGEFALDDINAAFEHIKNGKNGATGRVLIVI